VISLHSRSASDEMLAELKRSPGVGRILHWWIGTAEQTRRAIDLGCYFSLPPAAARNEARLEIIPIDRILTETDHPFGDRGAASARPGNFAGIENVLARIHGLSAVELRHHVWCNLGTLVRETGCGRLLPRAVQVTLAALPRS